MIGGLDGPALRPWEIRQLTLPEVSAYMDLYRDSKAPPGGTPIHSYADHLEMVRQRRAMTPADLLEEARQEFHG